MARDDYFVLVYGILRYAYECLKSGEPVDVNQINHKALGIERVYWEYIMLHLAEDGYVSGVEPVKRLGTAKPGVRILGFEITPKGIDYLESNLTIKKAEAAAMKAFGFATGILNTL